MKPYHLKEDEPSNTSDASTAMARSIYTDYALRRM